MLRLTLILAAASASAPALADDLLVPAEHATIQAAIDAALPGDTVLVSPGTYAELLNTLGKPITLASTDGPAATTIDSSGMGVTTLTISSGEGPDTRITGFTFTNDSETHPSQGGAVYLNGSSPTFDDCVFDTNRSVWGGAVYCLNNTDPSFTDCVFRDGNAYTTNGGGGGAGFFQNETSNASFTRCLFEGNYGRQGGAIWIYGSPITFTDCDFIDNLASVVAGAVQVVGRTDDQGLRPRFDRCRFLRNHAGDEVGFLGNGGAFEFFHRGAEINDSLFAGNTCDGHGPHIAHLIDSAADITNCTFYGYGGTSQPIITAQSHLHLTNCILWDPAFPFTALGSTVTVAHSIVVGGYSGTNNSSADPMFADPLGPDGVLGTDDDDFTLMPGSPAIDAGDNTARPTGADTDLAGNPRLSDDPDTADTGVGPAPIVDLGALEVQGPAAVCFADCDANGSLNIDDIDCFIAAFLGGDLAGADCDANGTLNIDDIDCFVASFLAGCP